MNFGEKIKKRCNLDHKSTAFLIYEVNDFNRYLQKIQELPSPSMPL